MSARKIRNWWYSDFYHGSRRYRIKSPENSRVGARAYELVLRQRLAHGEDITTPKEPEKKKIPAFREFSKKWLEIYVANNDKPSSQKSKNSILKVNLIPYFGKMPLNRITCYKIEEYKNEKKRKGLKPKTINNHLGVLGKCLRVAQEWEVLDSIPKIKLLSIPPQPYDFLTLEESKQLLNASKGMDYEMIFLALKTGLRLGEIRGLKWSDINLQNRLITVRRALVNHDIVSPKNNKTRNIPISTELYNVLENRKKVSSFVFGREPLKKPLSITYPSKRLHNVCKKAGLRRIGWHTLRHTFASHLAMAGIPITAIQELLGHSDIKVTMRYAHMSPQKLQSAVEILDETQNQDQEPCSMGRHYIVNEVHSHDRVTHAYNASSPIFS